MALSEFETAMSGVQSDVTDRVAEATPYLIGIAALLVVLRITVKLVKRAG